MSMPEIFERTGRFHPPIAPKIPYLQEFNGHSRLDNYHWMRLSDEQKDSPDPDPQTLQVIQYLEAENEYRKNLTAHLSKVEEDIFQELKSRIKQTDMSVPYFENGYYYITRHEEAKEYPVYTRKYLSLEAQEEILLDVNHMAEGFEYFDLGSKAISPDNQWMAYSSDSKGRRKYSIQIKNLQTAEILTDNIPNTSGHMVWANDNTHFFYVRKNSSLRDFKIFRHKLGTNSDEDMLVFHEKDELYNCYIYKSRSKKYLIIGSSSTLSDEYRILDANHPEGEFTIFQKRIPKLEFEIDHLADQWYILTNKDEAINFKLMCCSSSNTSMDAWVDLIHHNEEIFIEEFSLFTNFLSILIRKDGNTQMEIRPWKGDPFLIPFDEQSYTVAYSNNPEPDTHLLRIQYTSLSTPICIFDFNIQSKELVKLKQQEVLGEFNAADYITEYKMVEASDGAMIPLSIVYHKNYLRNASAPFLLYGYGSYGLSMDPMFSPYRLSLLNRGFGFAIAHIRGGQEKGRRWYENGKFLHKKNTFTDFIRCGEYLKNNSYCHPEKLYAMGGSAGGLLMGAVVNMQPQLWNGIIAAVPFVDVLTTMLDESIPLTTGEFEEWGNPKDPEYYAYMLSYSPIDNVERKDYPPMLITTGFHDSQVQYWEPAKWIAKLRDYKTDQNPLLLYCNMDTGHGGSSGRFRRLREIAMEYTFLLELSGKMN